MAEELRPCPFCGKRVSTFGPYGWYRNWGVTHSCSSFYSGAQGAFQGFTSEAEAIAAWNTRTPPTPTEGAEIVERLVEQGNKRGLYDTARLGPELVAYLSDRAGMLAALRDEMSEGYQSWLDDAVAALECAAKRTAEAFSATTQEAELTRLRQRVAELEGDKASIVAWLRMQDDKGAKIALTHDKGTTARASFGGGAYALLKAADAIESGEYLNDLAPPTSPTETERHEQG